MRPTPTTLRHVWTWKMPAAAGGWTLVGASRAADATAFFIPGLRWALDAGDIVDETRPKQIFVTHTHSDHVNRTTHLKSRRCCPGLYVPESAAPMLEHYLEAGARLSANLPMSQPMDYLDPSYTMCGVRGGQFYHLDHGKHGFDVEVIDCHHTVDCVGYIFYACRPKLKPELAGQPGEVLAQLRKQGQEIQTIERRPQFAYLGDTRPDVFASSPQLLDVPVVIVECTFLDDAERAKQTGHTSFDELLPVLKGAPEVTFVLIHLSHRHTHEQLIECVEAHALSNVVVWG